MTEGVQIIVLPPSRWAEYRALRLRALQESPQAFGSSHAENVDRPDTFWIGRLRDAESGRTPLLFAEDDGRLIGLVGAYVEPDEPDVANIVTVFVMPEYRGRGVGRLLVDAILAEIALWPEIIAARLTVNLLQTAAVATYRQAGFTVVATERNRMGDGELHEELIMERPLTRDA
jgi:ribosomal protein S18 acetylase RimI-like enzyme